jgi:CHAT domain-containing protein
MLARKGTQTLVFVQDGFLRNLSMAALYDGQRYLVEKYSIALAPGLELLAPQLPTPTPKVLKVLMVGLTQARQGFAPLPGVASEIDQIRQQLPGTVLLNQAFTKANLQTQINQTNFPILHVATHGQFSSEADQTFLLAWDQKVRVRDLQGLLRMRQQEQMPLELLVLSACQTARGDRSATLGLAGMALQSGAQSTLATLWSVNDRATALLMMQFYTALKQQSIRQKARSLQQAQIALLRQPEYSHPFYWSAFVLVGNWF